jgi:hypothetical protein
MFNIKFKLSNEAINEITMNVIMTINKNLLIKPIILIILKCLWMKYEYKKNMMLSVNKRIIEVPTKLNIGARITFPAILKTHAIAILKAEYFSLFIVTNKFPST